MKPYAPVKQDSDTEEALLSQELSSLGSDHECPASSEQWPVRRWTVTEVVFLFLLISSNAGWFMHRFRSASGPHDLAYCELS